jgi:hypothetical protein
MSVVSPRTAVIHITDRWPIVALVLLCLLLISSAAGQTNSDAAQVSLPPGIQILMDVTPKAATVGDPIRFDLDITMPGGWQANISKPEKQIGDFSIIEFFPGPVVPEAASSQKPVKPAPAQESTLGHHHTRIIAAIYRTGNFTFPPVHIQLRTPEGKQLFVLSPPAIIEIRSVLAEKDLNLKEMKRQAEIPEERHWIIWLIVLLGLGILCVIAWILWRRRRKHQPYAPATPPRDLLDMAESDLRSLLARGLPEGHLVKEFYVLLSEIVKRILEAGCRIQTAERTTSEIMDSLRRESGRVPEDMDRIESLLLRCDFVKFAKYIPGKSEHETAAQNALWILEISRQSAVGSRQEAVCSGQKE